MTPEQIRQEILRLTRTYAEVVHPGHLPANHPARPAHDPTKDGVPYAARVFGPEHLHQARLIAAGQMAGMTLAQMKEQDVAITQVLAAIVFLQAVSGEIMAGYDL